MYALRSSAVECQREHERARLRIVEERDAAAPDFRPAEIRLVIPARVLRPGVQVTTRELYFHAREAKAARYPWLVEGECQRDLAELHVAAVFDELRQLRAEAAAIALEPVGDPIAVAVAARGRTDEVHCLVRAGPDDCLIRVPALPEHLLTVTAFVGVEVRSEEVERARGSVPHLAALLDVDEAGDAQLSNGERVVHAARPAWL